MIEGIIYILLAFFGGAYLGQSNKSDIDNLTSNDHRKLMRECSISCGKNRFKSYDVMRGECLCSTDKSK